MGSGVNMKLYGIDIETDDPYLTDKGASWVYGEGEVIVTGLYNAKTKVKKALVGSGGKIVRNLLLDSDAALVGTNLQYDIGWLCYEHNLKAKDVRCNLIDVAIAEASIDEFQQYGLDPLALKYLRERKGSSPLKAICERLGYKGDFRKHLKKLWDAGYKQEIKDYVISDADQPVRIWEKQLAILTKKTSGAEDFTGCMDALETNFKLIKIVLGMKQRGVRIDMEKRKKNYATLKKVQEDLRKAFDDKYSIPVMIKGKQKDCPVNVNSTKQLAELFDKERVPYVCKIRIKSFGNNLSFEGSELWEQKKILKSFFNGVRVQKGQLVLFVPKQYAERTNDEIRRMGYITTCNPSIDKEALNKLRKTHEVAKTIAELKQVTSIIDKFLGEKLDRFIVKHSENDFRIHSDFNIVGARRTGRFSNSNPNLQQVPSKTKLFANTEKEIKLYKLCRETIIPDEGYLIGKADYSGQENRLMAHFAIGKGSEDVRRRYNENPDFDEHQWVADTAKALLGIDLERKIVKTIKFGLGYGQQVRRLCEINGWVLEEGEKLFNAYNDTMPFVKATMDRVSDVIVKRGFIRTLAGRHCHLKKYNGKPDKRSAYKGFNKLIQGSAADMMKKALVMLDEHGLLDVFPLYLTVHDEIDFGIPKNVEAIRRLPEIQNVMEHTFPLSVPIRVDPEIGHDWGHVSGRREKKDKETGKVISKENMEQFIKRIIKEVCKNERVA